MDTSIPQKIYCETNYQKFQNINHRKDALDSTHKSDVEYYPSTCKMKLSVGFSLIEIPKKV